MTQRSTPHTRFESLLPAWGQDVTAGRPRPGKHLNDVRTVYVEGREYVGRLSARPPASIEWELRLLDHLAGCGIAVPEALATGSGERHHGGLVLTPRLTYPHPDSDQDWDRVRDQLSRIHEVTRGWPQRPDCVGETPPDAYVSAKAELPGGSCVVVGRTRRRDIAMTERGPAFVDWDEARVDPPALDFVGDERLARRSGLPGETDRWARVALAARHEWRGLPA